jgi:ribose 5-phosphate isomerase B
MKVAVGSDHAGFSLKESVRGMLEELGHEVVDVGVHSKDRADYPDYAHQVAEKVAGGECERGVLVCGSGIGMAMSANRHKGIRAANCVLGYQAEMTRKHNDANVLCLGERVVGPGVAEQILRLFFSTDFEGGRHEGRVKKIDDR